jgi:hypothetical protein
MFQGREMSLPFEDLPLLLGKIEIEGAVQVLIGLKLHKRKSSSSQTGWIGCQG